MTVDCMHITNVVISDLLNRRLLTLVKHGNTERGCPRCFILTKDFAKHPPDSSSPNNADRTTEVMRQMYDHAKN